MHIHSCASCRIEIGWAEKSFPPLPPCSPPPSAAVSCGDCRSSCSNKSRHGVGPWGQGRALPPGRLTFECPLTGRAMGAGACLSSWAISFRMPPHPPLPLLFRVVIVIHVPKSRGMGHGVGPGVGAGAGAGAWGMARGAGVCLPSWAEIDFRMLCCKAFTH